MFTLFAAFDGLSLVLLFMLVFLLGVIACNIGRW